MMFTRQPPPPPDTKHKTLRILKGAEIFNSRILLSVIVEEIQQVIKIQILLALSGSKTYLTIKFTHVP